MDLILASRSPRRRELLSAAGFRFTVETSRVEEAPRPGEAAEAFARRAAQEKALEVAGRLPAGPLVLGADTVVALEEEILGKPTSHEDARRMLRLLSGKTHRVITGVCLVLAPETVKALGHESTCVTFAELSPEGIEAYLRSGEPFDKAGAYGIQGLASKFVRRIEGCYFNVVGLPIPLLYQMLKTLVPIE